MNNSNDNFSSQPVGYGDVIYSKSFSAFNGHNDSICAKIIVSVDSDGVIQAGDENTNGVVPGKIQFLTANDSGNLKIAGTFDKAGRLLTGDHWAITKNPSGYPLVLMLNTEEPGNGATLSLKRSRGTYHSPKSVINGDSIFKISWYAHDGQSYKETSAIHSKIEGDVALGRLPTSLTFKTFDTTAGIPTDSLKINADKSVSVTSLSALNASVLTIDSPVRLMRIADETERDCIMPTALPGTLIFLSSLDTVQVYTANQGWKSLF